MDMMQIMHLIKELKDAEFTGQLEINFHNGGVGKSYTRQQICTKPGYINKKQASYKRNSIN